MKKMSHFKKNWDTSLQDDVLDMAKKNRTSFRHIIIKNTRVKTALQFKERYDKLNESNGSAPPPPRKKRKTLGLLREDDSDSDDSDNEDDISADPTQPWLAEFQRYLDTNDIMPEEMSVVEWWGVRIIFLFPFSIFILILF